nr:hypothetical protein [Tanacetum cinerariifolium]
CKLRQKIYNWRMSIPWMQINFLAMQTVVATSSTEVEYVGEANYVYKLSRMNRRTCYIKQECVKSQSPRTFKRGQDIKIPQSGGPLKRMVMRLSIKSRETTSASTSANGKMEITATIDGRIKTITEASIRRHLKLEDSDGVTTLPSAKNFKQLVLMGADTEILLDQEEPTELVEDLGSGEKGEKEISIANIPVSTARVELSTVIPEVSTTAENLVYIRRKIAKQLQEAIAEADPAYDIDWNDPVVLRYHALQNRSFTIAESIKKSDKIKASGFVQKQFAEEDSEKKDDGSSESVGGSRKKTVAKKRIGAKLNEESAKRQKLKDVTEEVTAEYKKEKEELRLDKQDLNDLYSLVQERFQDHPLEGHDLLLWGDLRMIFDPHENDELWMNQLDWKLLRWKLHENCRVHPLFMDGAPMEINMLVEKKYLLIKELLEKMLNLQLEAEEESTMAFELIKFIKSLLEN